MLGYSSNSRETKTTVVNRIFVPLYDLRQRRKWAYKVNKHDITRSKNDPLRVWPSGRLIASKKKDHKI